MSPISIPLYTEDNIYASYLDRLLIKSLGVQAGVVEENDYKVSAGSGLQVKVEKGKAFVAQTGAIEESGNTFFNGLYNVLSSTESTPYNNVEVSAVNPQIAQIILRVYDVGELKISGQSFARLEWLNGTPNAGATKLHILEGKSSEFGAAALPQSSFRLCYVVVPKNAVTSSEYTLLDERMSSQEPELKLLRTSATGEILANPGQLIKTTATNAQVSLPEQVENAVVGVFCSGTTTLVSANLHGGLIYGDFVNGSGNITLTTNQHVRLRGDGTNWLIIDGEPKREQVYGAFVSRAETTEYEPSSSRPASVVLRITQIPSTVGLIYLPGGETIRTATSSGTSLEYPFSFDCSPGKKWKWVTSSGTMSVASSYLIK